MTMVKNFIPSRPFIRFTHLMHCACLSLLAMEASAHRSAIDPLAGSTKHALALAKAGAETGRIVGIAEGLALLREAKAEAEKVPASPARDMVFAAIANELAGFGEKTEALALVRKVEETHDRAATLGKIASKMPKSDSLESQSLLAEAISLARNKLKGDESLALVAELAGKQFKSGHKPQALLLLDSCEAAMVAQPVTDPLERAELLAELAANRIAFGQKEKGIPLFEKALALVVEVKDPFYRTALLAQLGGELAEKGEHAQSSTTLEQAVQSLKQVKDKRMHADLQSEIARNFSQAKNFKRAQESAKGVEDAYFRSEALIRIGKNLARYADSKQAESALAEAEVWAAQIKDSQRKAVVLAKIAGEYAHIGGKEKAIRLIQVAQTSARG